MSGIATLNRSVQIVPMVQDTNPVIRFSEIFRAFKLESGLEFELKFESELEFELGFGFKSCSVACRQSKW